MCCYSNLAISPWVGSSHHLAAPAVFRLLAGLRVFALVVFHLHRELDAVGMGWDVSCPQTGMRLPNAVAHGVTHCLFPRARYGSRAY